ncbi:hypothetical protein [Vibrio intestinalis]|uniref:hypothetical protein n=1 Tax=Vibrio intestinalis TaxID=2933291 RepID=UPI0021A675EF|nr:hypothetical protein [Vibrio intestinalis]
MRIHSLRTICLILFSSLTLILSSVVSSAPLMPIQMMQMSEVSQSCHSMAEETTQSMTMHHTASYTTSSPIDCETNNSFEHNCCDTTCITVVAALLHPPIMPAQHSQLVAFNHEPTRSIVKVSRSLYRPPSL